MRTLLTAAARNGVVETSGAKNIPGPSGQTSDGAPGNFYH